MLLLQQNKYILPGYIVLKLDDKIVWYGPISDPWEDVVCDTAVINTSDFEKVAQYLLDSPIFAKWRNK